MKKRIQILAVLIALVATVAPAAAFAATAPATPKPGSSFAQRLAQRKAERSVKLDEKSQRRLEQRCVNAQGKVRNFYQTATKSVDDRNRAYQRVDAKLWVTIGRLKLAGQDTFQLERQRSSLATKINDFQATGANFTQTLDDLQIINCAADPAGFKALLDTARLYYKQVVDKSNDINGYVVNDIKATLASHVANLQPKAETD